jgi:hypothetical protein
MDVERIHIAVCGGKSGRRFVVKNGLGELALDYKLTVAVDGEDTELHSRNGCWRGVSDTIRPMRGCILLLALGCLISRDAWSAEKPVLLTLEGRTTLHVGELAVLQIPPDRRYSHFDANTGAGNVLVLIRRSRRTALYRAVRPGPGTIVIGPDVPRGECISCETLHYFITVVPQK